jgi:hypothetical protein
VLKSVLQPVLTRCQPMEVRLDVQQLLTSVHPKEPKRRTREGRGEWEPIKILLKNSAYEPDFTRAPPQAYLAKFSQPPKCY